VEELERRLRVQVQLSVCPTCASVGDRGSDRSARLPLAAQAPSVAPRSVDAGRAEDCAPLRPEPLPAAGVSLKLLSSHLRSKRLYGSTPNTHALSRWHTSALRNASVAVHCAARTFQKSASSPLTPPPLLPTSTRTTLPVFADFLRRVFNNGDLQRWRELVLETALPPSRRELP
jgi:hypothetical protein